MAGIFAGAGHLGAPVELPPMSRGRHEDRATQLRLRAAVALSLLVPAGCGSGTNDPGAAAPDAHSHDHGEHDHDDHASAPAPVYFGRPASPEAADRIIRVFARDPFVFDPAQISVRRGETITFAVINKGTTMHEFVIGDHAYHDAHAAQMSSGQHAHSEENAIAIAPGEKGKLTWTFDTLGQFFFACHEPGHYIGGMVGLLVVSG